MDNNNQISDQIMHLINTIIFFEKKSVFLHNGIKLYPSEIHLMKLIQGGCTANATTMAMALGITKGAVSQTISRLVKKEIICKSNNVSNKNELIVSLTKNGISALKQFDKKMEHNSAAFDRYIESISSHDKKIIELFINNVESFVKNI